MRRIMPFIVFIGMVIVSYQAFENPFSNDYIASIKNVSAPVSNDQDELYQEIKDKAGEYEKPAEDAVLHKVWKKIPGLNGVKVNVEKSYKKMKKQGEFNEDFLVFEQVPPEVTLEDLPAAPIYRGHPDKKMVGLNINVSWGEDHIPTILNILKKQHVKATFFIEGKWANKHEDLVKMIDEQGHEIGNHAFNHPDMKNLSAEESQKQIQDTNKILESITGKKPKWFAPPSGSFNEDVIKVADELGMETILWTVDTVDWKKPAPSVMINRVMGKIHNGAFILMHPTDPVAEGLTDLILKIKEKEYKIGNVTTLLDEERNYITSQKQTNK
ncbi:polysaccharide deacetylase family protein [Pontibacillus marinus]|uniref:NodB homology domain-containing protein n=1 Tax=Pontibacillus marinus BH030004 = DSM 16465 TaxID=1385511 RepID=A0A0A5FW88_9BACI|nr:polysaccharide deacetylase family protein [Pontibacillus marinus]KGX83293.1 hypothetical protein N783_05065 [Pontibacillus marinus BH030004 = DSM 16465]